MHAYLDGKHERRTRDILAELLPGVSITLSSEVSPEIREYERFSTAVRQRLCAAADGALSRPPRRRRCASAGVGCPLFLMTSGGGLDDARDRAHASRSAWSNRARPAAPSWPRRIARQCGLDKVLSFDMGGTTAKICLIDDGEPQHSRTFEVARAVPLPEGQRPAAAHPGHRDGRDRRRRRLDRRGRSAAAHQRRPGERRRRARARPATAAAAPSRP